MSEFLPLALVVVILVGFQTRRMGSVQTYHPVTLWARVLLLALLGIAVLMVEMASRSTVAGLALGLFGGVLLGGYTLQRTRFWKDDDPPRYQTGPYIGAVVGGVFALRVLYGAMVARSRLPNAHAVNPLAVSWLAALLYFLFVTYWEVYYLGVIRTLRGQRQQSH